MSGPIARDDEEQQNPGKRRRTARCVVSSRSIPESELTRMHPDIAAEMKRRGGLDNDYEFKYGHTLCSSHFDFPPGGKTPRKGRKLLLWPGAMCGASACWTVEAEARRRDSASRIAGINFFILFIDF